MVPIIELDGGTTDTGGAMIGTPANGRVFALIPIIFCLVEARWDCRRGVLIETVTV